MKRNTIIDISKKILNKQVLHNQNDLKNCAKDIINYWNHFQILNHMKICFHLLMLKL